MKKNMFDFNATLNEAMDWSKIRGKNNKTTSTTPIIVNKIKNAAQPGVISNTLINCNIFKQDSVFYAVDTSTSTYQVISVYYYDKEYEGLHEKTFHIASLSELMNDKTGITIGIPKILFRFVLGNKRTLIYCTHNPIVITPGILKLIQALQIDDIYITSPIGNNSVDTEIKRIEALLSDMYKDNKDKRRRDIYTLSFILPYNIPNTDTLIDGDLLVNKVIYDTYKDNLMQIISNNKLNNDINALTGKPNNVNYVSCFPSELLTALPPINGENINIIDIESISFNSLDEFKQFYNHLLTVSLKNAGFNDILNAEHLSSQSREAKRHVATLSDADNVNDFGIKIFDNFLPFIQKPIRGEKYISKDNITIAVNIKGEFIPLKLKDL